VSDLPRAGDGRAACNGSGKLSAAGTIKDPVRVMFEPKLASFYAWTVYAGDKPISYSWQDCTEIK
jgi:hypothetical protein